MDWTGLGRDGFYNLVVRVQRPASTSPDASYPWCDDGRSTTKVLLMTTLIEENLSQLEGIIFEFGVVWLF